MIKRVLISTVAVGVVFAAVGFDNKLKFTEYTIESDKVSKPVRIAFLSDIHSAEYKDEGRRLFSLIDKAEPDCVLLGGDVFHKYASDESFNATYRLIKNIHLKYNNCCFVTGNHEIQCGKADEIKKSVSSLGINILGEESFVFTSSQGQPFLVGGTDFAGIGEDIVLTQKEHFIKKAEETGLFSVLVRHVPMRVDGDKKTDLILSGHNHGGLWRLPKTNLGVAGGGGKVFPRYAYGKYNFENYCLIVGSGITTETYLMPRLYNPPEVVSVRVIPKK